jgi:hypothetical protein
MVLDLDPIQTPWVHEAFRRAADWQSLQSVYRWIRGLPEDARGGRSMPYQAVRRLLASPLYVARPLHGDADVLARPVAHWPAIVDDRTWQRVRGRVAQHQHVPRQASRRYLLAGFLRCHCCGARMHGHQRRQAPKYRCTAARHGAEAGRRACYAELHGDRVDAAVLAEVLPLIEGAVSTLPELREALERAWAALREPATVQDELQERQRQQVLRDAEQARHRLTRAAVLFADEDIDKVGYELLRNKAQADLEAATEALGHLEIVEPRITLPPLETVLAAADGWSAVMRDDEIAAQREVLAVLIERVVPVRVGRGQYEVEITWTPLGEGLRHAIRALQSGDERSAA